MAESETSKTKTKTETVEKAEVQVKQVGLSPDKVVMLGAGLILFGMLGFYFLPGMIVEDAGGYKLNNAFYCSVITLTTVGFGDICPGKTDLLGRVFLTVLPLLGLGFFCGPLLDLASSWQRQVPGGVLALGTFTLAMGVSMLIVIEGMSYSEAIHLCVITGTTIGYGNLTPTSDLGRFSLALYAILICNVMGGVLDVGRKSLEKFCKDEVDANVGKTKQKSSANKETKAEKQD